MELLTPEQRVFLKTVCSKPNRWRVNKRTNRIDVDVNVNMFNMHLTEIPVKFGRVMGDFNCSCNNLTTLENFPTYVKGSLFLSMNNLTDYFKNLKEDDFKLWDKIVWMQVLKEYPFLINIGKKYYGRLNLEWQLKCYPHLKLYLE